MTYCLEWRLVGRASRLLDHGEIDEAFPDRALALQALHAFLLTFAVRGRNKAEDYWWGRRSADADLEVRVLLRQTVNTDPDAGPVLISKRTNHRGGENDSRRPEPAEHGRRRIPRVKSRSSTAARASRTPTGIAWSPCSGVGTWIGRVRSWARTSGAPS